MLLRPGWHWTVVTLCRAGDTDRAPRFHRAMERLGASGRMADLDDGPEQTPLAAEAVQGALQELLGAEPFDLVLTHGARGEYTRHMRHEEVSRAVAALWLAGTLHAQELWTFAYEDGGGAHLPRADAAADRRERLPQDVWRNKRSIITNVYGFGPDSFEARTTPRVEAFRCFDSAQDLRRRGHNGGDMP